MRSFFHIVVYRRTVLASGSYEKIFGCFGSRGYCLFSSGLVQPRTNIFTDFPFDITYMKISIIYKASFVSILYGKGTLAEYVSISSICVAPLPKAAGFGMAEGAALNGNGQVVALMMKNGRVQKGDRVFVNGESGGFGTLVVQIAKAKGAYVVARASGGIKWGSIGGSSC